MKYGLKAPNECGESKYHRGQTIFDNSLSAIYWYFDAIFQTFLSDRLYFLSATTRPPPFYLAAIQLVRDRRSIRRDPGRITVLTALSSPLQLILKSTGYRAPGYIYQ